MNRDYFARPIQHSRSVWHYGNTQLSPANDNHPWKHQLPRAAAIAVLCAAGFYAAALALWGLG